MGILFLIWYTGRDSFAFLPGNGQKQRCHARRAGHEQQSPGLLHLNVRVPSRPEGETNKRDTLTGIPLICLVHRKGLEPPTLGTGIRCSIH